MKASTTGKEHFKMKKYLKMLSVTLVMVLLIGIMPVQAMEMPVSFDFEYEIQFIMETNIDDAEPRIQPILEALAGEGVIMSYNGTVVFTHAFTFQMFYEMNVRMPELNIPLVGNIDVTLRYWLDADFSDLDNPILFAIMELELPPLLRMMLNTAAPELAYQFFVMDLSDVLVFTDISEDEIDEFFEMFHDMFAYIGYYATQIWEEIRDYVTFDFDFDFGALENGYFADFAALVTIYDGVDFVELFLGFGGSITNFNTATMPAFPELTDENSIDITSFL